MNAIEIRILLKGSLNAAFRGEAFEGPEIFHIWGKEFFAILENEYPNIVMYPMIWNIVEPCSTTCSSVPCSS
jgi:hypothetical protein